MPAPETDWRLDDERYDRLLARAGHCGGWSLPPGLVMTCLGLADVVFSKYPVRAWLVLVGGLLVLTAAALLLTAQLAEMPPGAVVATTWALIGGVLVSAVPILGLGIFSCTVVVHVMAVIPAVLVLTERRS